MRLSGAPAHSSSCRATSTKPHAGIPSPPGLRSKPGVAYNGSLLAWQIPIPIWSMATSSQRTPIFYRAQQPYPRGQGLKSWVDRLQATGRMSGQLRWRLSFSPRPALRRCRLRRQTASINRKHGHLSTITRHLCGQNAMGEVEESLTSGTHGEAQPLRPAVFYHPPR